MRGAIASDHGSSSVKLAPNGRRPILVHRRPVASARCPDEGEYATLHRGESTSLKRPALPWAFLSDWTALLTDQLRQRNGATGNHGADHGDEIQAAMTTHPFLGRQRAPTYVALFEARRASASALTSITIFSS